MWEKHSLQAGGRYVGGTADIQTSQFHHWQYEQSDTKRWHILTLLTRIPSIVNISAEQTALCTAWNGVNNNSWSLHLRQSILITRHATEQLTQSLSTDLNLTPHCHSNYFLTRVWLPSAFNLSSLIVSFFANSRSLPPPPLRIGSRSPFSFSAEGAPRSFANKISAVKPITDTAIRVHRALPFSQ